MAVPQTLTFTSTRTSRGYLLTLIITENSISVDTNKSSCTYELRISTNNYTYGQYGTGFEVTVNGQRIAYQDRNNGTKSSCLSQEPSYTTLSSGSFTIQHENDGTLANVPVIATLDIGGSPAPGDMSLNGTATFTQIPRQSSLTIPSLVCGTAATITVNKQASTLKDTVAYSTNGTNYTTIGTAKSTATSISWTPPLSLQSNFPNSVTGSIYIRCTTYDSTGNTEVGSTVYTVNVAASSVPTFNANPTFSPVYTNSFLSGSGVYLAGFTKVNIVCGATAQYGASITSWLITGLGDSATVTGASLNYTTGTLSITGAKNVTVKVTDSRGLSASVTISSAVTYIPYYSPTISSLTCDRGTYSGSTWTANENGNHIRVQASVQFTNVNGNTYNGSGVAVAVTGQTTQYITGTPSSGTLSGTKYFTGTSIDSEYTVTVSVTDKLGGTGSMSATVTSGSVLMNWNPSLNSVSFGKIATTANLLDSAWNIQSKKSTATAVAVHAINSVGDMALHTAASGNRGLYDATTGTEGWIIYRRHSDSKVLIPEYVPDGIIFYGTCSTAAATQAKEATVASTFALTTGVSVRIKFTNAQTYNGQPTLNVNSTGAKGIVRNGTTAANQYYWAAGEVVDLTYDGTNWVRENGTIATTTYYGLTKLSSSTSSTSTAMAATPSAVKAAYDLASAAVPKAGSMVQVWSNTSGATSGNWSNFANYSAYLLLGRVTNGGSLVSMTIPADLFVNTTTASSGLSVVMSDEVAYATYYLYYSGTTGYFSRKGATNSSYGKLYYIYGIY